MKTLHRNLFNLLLALALVAGNTAFVPGAAASDMYDNSIEPTGEAMLFDGVLVRPAMLVGTALGIVGFVVTLPFSILGGNVDDAGKELVIEPAAYTFARPLGEM